uniref:Ycf80 n=1 Tax=Chondria sp. (in: red algae) TaxID=1982705 RepID=A0A1Z1MQA1_9FLOR|nr:hypothetical protein [Chondria sp. (in: red algae)]
MILFNFSFYNPILYLSHKYDLYTKLQLSKSIYSKRKNFNLSNLQYHRSYYLISLNSKSNFKFFQRAPKTKIIKRNFWQKLVNKYWQETIFISSSNSLLENYTNKLKSTGLSVHEGNDYKNFLLEFSKDLLDRKMNFNLKTFNNGKISSLVNKNNVYIKYKWLKSYNPNILLTKYNSTKLYHSNYMKSVDNSLPLFVLINSSKQIILAESTDQLSHRQTLMKVYHKFTQRGLYTKKLYTGLFFINPEDAMEYQNYIKVKYNKSSRDLQIKLVATTLNFYNKMLSKSSSATEFRLIPDLQEVGNLLYRYKKHRNLHFDTDQKYGPNYFQGQPIYVIKPVKSSKNLDSTKYLYLSYNRKKQIMQYDPIFLNHKTAINAWKTYKKSSSNYHLPLKPVLYVSNLETFIKTSDYIKNKDKFIFLPSLETFDFLKTYLQNSLKNNNYIWKILKENSVILKSLCYRALWSLTTRQPNIW